MITILLPGLDGTGELFKRVVSQCPSRFSPQIVTYPVDRALSYLELEVIVREQLPRNHPFIIVAESFSGPVAITLASRRMDNLHGVVLAASFVTPPRSCIWKLVPWRTLFRFPVAAGVVRQLLAPSDPSLVRELRAATRAVMPHVLADRVRSALSVDVRGELARLTCALLYIQAGKEHVVPARCLRDIMSVQKNVVVKVLDAPHPVLQHEPEAAWELIERFASGIHAD
ncbi:MAG: alpha/beta fold hydrolase [Planctomycetota bacterium]|jgi:pimeloyl-ACP methyl ester carboxylesterase